MTSPPLDGTHGRKMSDVACHHLPWAPHIVKLRRVWHDITALGQHAQSDDGERGMTSPPLDNTHGRQHMAWHTITALGHHTRSDYVGSGMTSPPLDRTHFRTTSGVACHHRLWTAHMVERRRAWHAIIAFTMHIWSDDFGCGMTSSPLGSTHGRTMSGMA